MASFTIRSYDHESVTISVIRISAGDTIRVFIRLADDTSDTTVDEEYIADGSAETLKIYGLSPDTDYLINVKINDDDWLGAQAFTTEAESETYTITLSKEGGSGGDSSVDVTIGYDVPDIDEVPLKSGYRFSGYYTQRQDEQTSKNVQYYDEEGYCVLDDDKRVWSYEGNITIYAYWEKEYTITLDKQGGSGGTSSIDLIIGESVRHRIATPYRDDYTFLGYFTQKQSEATDIIVQYYDADGICVLENREWTTEYNITIYAHWRSITANFAWTYEKVKDKPFNLTADEWNALAAFVNSKRSKAYSFTVAVKDEPFTADIYNEMVDAIGAGTEVEKGDHITADLMNELVTNANNM